MNWKRKDIFWLIWAGGNLTITGNTDARKFIWTTWTGVEQSTPIDGYTSARVGAASVSTTTVVTVSGDMLQDCVSKFGTQNINPGAGQTKLYSENVTSTGVYSSYEATTTIGTTGRMSAITTGTNDLAYLTLSFKAAAAASVISNSISIIWFDE